MAKSSFDRRFDRWMQEPEFAESYRLHRARIDAIDTLMRALDEERERQKMTKADLARRIDAEPAAIRRLFTEARPNPQIGRLVDMAHELGLEITVQRRRRKPTARSALPLRPSPRRVVGSRVGSRATSRCRGSEWGQHQITIVASGWPTQPVAPARNRIHRWAARGRVPSSETAVPHHPRRARDPEPLGRAGGVDR